LCVLIKYTGELFAMKTRGFLAVAGVLAILAPGRGLAQEQVCERTAAVVFSLTPLPSKIEAGFPSLRYADRTQEVRLPEGSPVRTDSDVTLPSFSFVAAGRDFLSDAAQIWTYPFHVTSRDLLPLGLLAATAVVLIPNDEGVNKFLTRNVVDGDRDDKFSPIMSQMGSYGAWGTAGAFLAFGALTGDHKAVETAGLAASAMLQTQLVVRVAKMVSGRLRPWAQDGADSWSGPAGYFQPGPVRTNDSFPSGHTAMAFSLATVVAMQYGDHKWVPIAAYAVAAGVGFARLSGNRHWLSDVVIGGVVGHLIARTVVRNYHMRHGVRPVFAIGPGGVAVGASYEFH
jgi:membrane-associated phospholipid phosphatase